MALTASTLDKPATPQWYDSVWLNAYYQALDIVAAVAPGRFEEFVGSFDILRTRPDFSTRALPDVLDPDTLDRLQSVVKALPREKLELHELQLFGRFVVHDVPEFTALQHDLTEQASQWAGEPLEPSYNFLSLYTHLGECRPHLDAPNAKWTLDLCLGQSEPWPIHVSKVIDWPDRSDAARKDWFAAIKSDPDLEFEPFLLEPGGAILFSGSSQWHYRDALPRDGKKRFCDLLFMHFIPAGASELVAPEDWARLFDIPELGVIGKVGGGY